MIADAFLPSTPLAFFGVGCVLVAVAVLGWTLQSSRAAWVPWAVAVAGLTATEVLVHAQPAGYRMLSLCGAMLYGMKVVVGAASVRSGTHPLPVLPWLAFATLWMGMRPKAFLSEDRRPKTGARKIAFRGMRNIAIGTVLFVIARQAALRDQRTLALLCGLPALSLWVHFGLFHLQVALFRSRGLDVSPLFRNPPLSKSLAEFWGRRWNLAFSEMTALAVHRPLRARIGAGPAVTAAFLFSGLLHELAISMPVQAGWGLPMAYFGLHAFAMACERRLTLTGWAARAWTIAWVLAPLPLLFHRAFIHGIVDPLLGL